jgi:hypothetical protein
VLLKRAEEARTEALNLDPETPFLGSVAVKYSDHQKTRYRGGDTGWLEEGKADHRWEREVTEVLFSLSEPGEISPVITTKKAHYIIKLMETKKASVRPLDQVRDRIHYQLMKQKRAQIENEFLDELKGKVPVKVFSSRLDTIKPPKAASEEKPQKPPALPGQKKEKEM